MIELVVEQTSGIATLLQISLNGSASAVDLADLEFPEVEGSKGLVISGFPQWAAGAIAVEFKNRVKWIAFVDPKLSTEKSAIIIWSLDRAYRRGDIVPLSSLGLNSPVAAAGN